MQEDTIHHKDLRSRLIQDLRRKGIYSDSVLGALGKVPRHLFVDGTTSVSELYADKPLEIGHGQTISQPYTVAFQTQLLCVEKGDRVLEIGTGSGYQAAVLFEMGAEVYSIERQEVLYAQTSARLRQLGYSGIHTFYGDGNSGLPKYAPYNKVLVTAESPEIPSHLIEQLKIGGLLVIPIQGRMKRIHKLSEEKVHIEDFGAFLFVPMLPGTVQHRQSGSA